MTTQSHAVSGRAGALPDGLSTLQLADGTVLAVQDYGPADTDTTVVLVHGWTQDHTSWDDVVPRLVAADPELRVVAYDARGHGWSDAGPRRQNTIAQLGDDLADVIGQLAPTGDVVIAGHSLGGPVIMAFAERHPDLVRDRVRGVVLVATSAAGLGRDIFGLPALLTRPALAVTPTVTRIRSWSRGHVNLRHPDPLAFVIRTGFYGPGQGTSRNRRRTAAQVGRSHPATTAQLVDELISHDRLASLHGLDRTSTLVLAGTRDGLCPMAHSRAMAEVMPQAELVVYPGAGHMLPYERPDEVAAQIVRRARSVDGVSATTA